VLRLAGSPRESRITDAVMGGIRYSEALREFQKIFVLTVLREQKMESSQGRRDLRRAPQYLATTHPPVSARHQVLTHDASSARPRASVLYPGQERTCDVGALCSSNTHGPRSGGWWILRGFYEQKARSLRAFCDGRLVLRK